MRAPTPTGCARFHCHVRYALVSFACQAVNSSLVDATRGNHDRRGQARRQCSRGYMGAGGGQRQNGMDALAAAVALMGHGCRDRVHAKSERLRQRDAAVGHRAARSCNNHGTAASNAHAPPATAAALRAWGFAAIGPSSCVWLAVCVHGKTHACRSSYTLRAVRGCATSVTCRMFAYAVQPYHHARPHVRHVGGR